MFFVSEPISYTVLLAGAIPEPGDVSPKPYVYLLFPYTMPTDKPTLLLSFIKAFAAAFTIESNFRVDNLSFLDCAIVTNEIKRTTKQRRKYFIYSILGFRL